MLKWILVAATVVAAAVSLYASGLFASADSAGSTVLVTPQQLPTPVYATNAVNAVTVGAS